MRILPAGSKVLLLAAASAALTWSTLGTSLNPGPAEALDAGPRIGHSSFGNNGVKTYAGASSEAWVGFQVHIRLETHGTLAVDNGSALSLNALPGQPVCTSLVTPQASPNDRILRCQTTGAPVSDGGGLAALSFNLTGDGCVDITLVPFTGDTSVGTYTFLADGTPQVNTISSAVPIVRHSILYTLACPPYPTYSPQLSLGPTISLSTKVNGEIAVKTSTSPDPWVGYQIHAHMEASTGVSLGVARFDRSFDIVAEENAYCFSDTFSATDRGIGCVVVSPGGTIVHAAAGVLADFQASASGNGCIDVTMLVIPEDSARGTYSISVDATKQLATIDGGARHIIVGNGSIEDCSISVDSDGDEYSDAEEDELGSYPDTFCKVMRADSDRDQYVSILDLNITASSLSAVVGDAQYSLRKDLGSDGSVSILDLSYQASVFARGVASCE